MTNDPVFIVGCPRTGTSWLYGCLKLHPKLSFIRDGKGRLAETSIAVKHPCFRFDSSIPFERRNEYHPKPGEVESFRELCEANLKKGQRVLGKHVRPSRVPFIRSVWPEAQIIHCTRSLLPRAWSLFQAATGKWYKPESPEIWANFAKVWPEELQKLWREHDRSPLVWACIDEIVWAELIHEDLSGVDYVGWPYEAFVNNPPRMMARLMRRLGLAPDVEVMSKVDGTVDFDNKYTKQATQTQIMLMHGVCESARRILHDMWVRS